jgi:hypothetical protein
MDRVQPTDTSSEPTVQSGAITHFGTETYPQAVWYYRTFLVAIQDNLDRITGQLCPTNKT